MKAPRSRRKGQPRPVSTHRGRRTSGATQPKGSGPRQEMRHTGEMAVSIVGRDAPPEAPKGDRLFPHPNRRLVLRLANCQMISMRGPWRGDATVNDLESGTSTALGHRFFPGRSFWPWVGGDRMAWITRRYRPVLTDLDGAAIATLHPRILRGPWGATLWGQLDPALLMVGRFGVTSVFSSDGRRLFHVAGKGQAPAGFTADGRHALVLRQNAPYGAASVCLFDATSGVPTETIDLRSIDPELAEALGRRVATKRSARVGSDALYGSFWHGRVKVEYEPMSHTIFLGVACPTGEVRRTRGEDCAVLEDRWIQVQIDR